MNFDMISRQIYTVAVNEAKLQKHEFVTPEHFLYATMMFDLGKKIITNSGGDSRKIINDLQEFLKSTVTKTQSPKPLESYSLIQMFELAEKVTFGSEKETITLGNLLVSIFSLKESYASYVMIKNNVDKLEMLKYISHEIDKEEDNVIIETENSTDKDNAFIEKYAYNMVENAKINKYDPVIGRQNTMERTIQVLLRRLKNNPIHVGLPGVGKTSVVEGLAQKIATKQVPDSLMNANIFFVDMGSVVAGTKYRGDFEERLIKLLELISKKENPIIYLDEIHQVVGAGSVSGGAMDATSILKPYLSKRNIKFIGSTTFDEYKKFIEKDKALSRRFQKIDVSEPTVQESIAILNGLKYKYEQFHNVKYPDDVIELACVLTNKYINDRHMPDKVIDAIDETGAYLRMNSTDNSTINITIDDIERTISLIAKIPTQTVSSDDSTKLQNLESLLKNVIFGQDKAIADVTTAIKLSRAGLKEEDKPIANLLFVGPTGVGKTEIAKQLAEKLGIKFIRFDMSEYQEQHSVAKLIGSPAGYVGYDDGGLLTEEIIRSPHCVLLLDEIEKAHQSIQNILLQVMDYGTLTDNTGKTADFRNVIIIMTSNAGAREIGKSVIGFDDSKKTSAEIDKEVERVFSPEFRNRLDEIIVFNHIDMQMAINITKKTLQKLESKLKDKNIILTSTKNIIDYIAEKGLSEKYGAREILRVIDKDMKKLLAEEVLFGNSSNTGKITLDYLNNSVVITVK